MFIGTNPTGRRAFNRIERRMPSLSKEMAGLILGHKHFGTPLTSKRKSVDKKLEPRNFEYVGSALSEIWSSLIINGHPAVAEYISKEPEAE